MKKIIKKKIIETEKRKELIIAYTSPNWKIQKNGLNITLTSGTGFHSEPQEGLGMVYITIEEK